MSRSGKCVSLALALASVAGCASTSTGMGAGEITAKGKAPEPVIFRWTSRDGGASGRMVATLPDAVYTGRFVRISRATEREMLAPLWEGWPEGWVDWPYWSGPWTAPYDAVQFIAYYTGKVVANLATDGGRRMRCRFHLSDPKSGMPGGGRGECQLPHGRTFDAVLNSG